MGQEQRAKREQGESREADSSKKPIPLRRRGWSNAACSPLRLRDNAPNAHVGANAIATRAAAECTSCPPLRSLPSLGSAKRRLDSTRRAQQPERRSQDVGRPRAWVFSAKRRSRLPPFAEKRAQNADESHMHKWWTKRENVRSSRRRHALLQRGRPRHFRVAVRAHRQTRRSAAGRRPNASRGGGVRRRNRPGGRASRREHRQRSRDMMPRDERWRTRLASIPDRQTREATAASAFAGATSGREAPSPLPTPPSPPPPPFKAQPDQISHTRAPKASVDATAGNETSNAVRNSSSDGSSSGDGQAPSAQRPGDAAEERQHATGPRGRRRRSPRRRIAEARCARPGPRAATPPERQAPNQTLFGATSRQDGARSGRAVRGPLQRARPACRRGRGEAPEARPARWRSSVSCRTSGVIQRQPLQRAADPAASGAAQARAADPGAGRASHGRPAAIAAGGGLQRHSSACCGACTPCWNLVKATYAVVVDDIDDDDELAGLGAVVDEGDAPDLNVPRERHPDTRTEFRASRGGEGETLFAQSSNASLGQRVPRAPGSSVPRYPIRSSPAEGTQREGGEGSEGGEEREGRGGRGRGVRRQRRRKGAG